MWCLVVVLAASWYKSRISITSRNTASENVVGCLIFQVEHIEIINYIPEYPENQSISIINMPEQGVKLTSVWLVLLRPKRVTSLNAIDRICVHVRKVKHACTRSSTLPHTTWKSLRDVSSTVDDHTREWQMMRVLCAVSGVPSMPECVPKKASTAAHYSRRQVQNCTKVSSETTKINIPFDIWCVRAFMPPKKRFTLVMCVRVRVGLPTQWDFSFWALNNLHTVENKRHMFCTHVGHNIWQCFFALLYLIPYAVLSMLILRW